jgi:DNA polymerase-3 subunit gamma/tau
MADTAPGAPAPRYTVTARKYRPQTFGDLVAQGHVAETLRNAIRSDRLAHAYLFSGPRGVGKTTAARILAKAVNCQTPLADRPDAEPCRTCDSCRAFEEGRSLNIIEVDAASNNKVEDVRELRDTVRVPPQGAKKKVYILDEVHMLSASAFNALLKTLEEPPPYVLFIFATTEPHKVLPTILSRTQRFDFRRIAVPEIVGRLGAVCAEEGVEADDESLVLLARKADGALRDALSLFDQALALCGERLEIGPLREALGVVDADLYFEATDGARAGDRAGLLDLVDRVVRGGHDLNEFVLGLADHVRNLLVARSTGSGELVEGTEATRERYLDAAGPYAEADLLHLLMLADRAAADLRESRQPRLTVELALLKMASLEPAADLGRLLGRLEALERAARDGSLPASALPPRTDSDEAVAYDPSLAAGGPAPGAVAEPTAGAPRPSQGGPDPERPAAAPAPPVQNADAVPSRSASPAAQTPAPQTPAPRDGDADGGGEPPPPSKPTPPPSAPPAGAPEAPSRPARAGALFGTPALKRGGDGRRGPAAALAVPVGEAGDGSAGPAPGAPAEHVGPELGRVTDVWDRFVAAARAEVGVRVGAVVGAGRPLRVRRGAVEVALADAFACRVADDHATALRDVLAGVLGEDAPPVRYVVAPEDAGETAAPSDPFERLKQLRQEHPVVRALFERFGAEIVWQ